MIDPALSPNRVTVTAPARLHLGFLDLNGGIGRKFGSIGLSISEPRTRLTIAFARESEIVGPESERVRVHLATMQEALGLRAAYRVKIEQAIPAHAGLGSGTQLALAVAAALRRLHGLPLDARHDAVRLRRGARSGVGIGLFEHGGVVVDGGHGGAAGVAPIISRLAFPEHWRIVVVLDPARHGLHGTDERAAFAALPPLPERSADRVCRLVLMKALPALVERDLAAFGAAIQEMQQLLGDYFAPMQGGRRFTSAHVGACLAALQAAGACGIGQSSWGPTGFAFAPSAAEADRLAAAARQCPDSGGLDIRVCTGLNNGADVAARIAAEAPMTAGR